MQKPNKRGQQEGGVFHNVDYNPFHFVSLNNRELLVSTGLPGFLEYRYVLKIHTKTNFTANIWFLSVLGKLMTNVNVSDKSEQL